MGRNVPLCTVGLRVELRLIKNAFAINGLQPDVAVLQSGRPRLQSADAYAVDTQIAVAGHIGRDSD